MSPKSLLLRCTFLFLPCPISPFPSSALDGINLISGGPDLITTLKDVENAYDVLHHTDDKEELLHLYAANNDQEAIPPLLDKYIKTCGSLGTQTYNNTTLTTHIQTYLDLTIKDLQALDHGPLNQAAYKKELNAHNAARIALANFLVTAYALDHYVHLTEATYWKNIDKQNYIRSNRYSAYLTLKAHNLPKALGLLDSIYQATADFQERTIYQLESADQAEKLNTTSANGASQAIKKYQSILDARQYCLYLYEAWVKWRAVRQQHSGLSKSSDIPNDHYDEVRDQAADVVLAYIQQNEKDEMAINQFFVLVTHDIVFRFGDYPYGNQNTVEYHQLFDN